ncbi:hypothetical protein GCM10022217_01350 [Chryseobacterium ginsenosidimutans]|uniref:DUF4365 domain-containing protein n=1 Tax=Chryseobacterium ginsenosidimutans TaxID=687846 RepID=UPI0031DEEFA0
MEDLPNRHRNHEIETLSDRYLKSKIPYSWVVNHFQVDYGTDYNCEIVLDRGVTGMNFTIQLKGKEKEVSNDAVKLNIKKSTLNRWNNRLEPTMIVAYIIDEDEAYWSWFSANEFDLTKPNESFTLTILKNNKLSALDWNTITDEIQKIFSRKHLLYSMPKLNSSNKDAWKLYFEKNYKAAKLLFYEMIKYDLKNEAVIYEALAICEYVDYNYTKAILNINKALEIEKNDSILQNKASILTEIGMLNNDLKKVDEALSIYEVIMKKEKNSSGLYYNFASALTKKAEYEKSIEYFLKAIHLNPNNPMYWNNLGNSYMNIGEHIKEMMCYDNALTLDPDQAETLFSKGSSLFRYFGKIDEGLTLMLQASEKTKRYEIDNPYLFFWISEAYFHKNDMDNAMKWNEKGLIYFCDDLYLKKQNSRLNNENHN